MIELQNECCSQIEKKHFFAVSDDMSQVSAYLGYYPDRTAKSCENTSLDAFFPATHLICALLRCWLQLQSKQETDVLNK